MFRTSKHHSRGPVAPRPLPDGLTAADLPTDGKSVDTERGRSIAAGEEMACSSVACVRPVIRRHTECAIRVALRVVPAGEASPDISTSSSVWTIGPRYTMSLGERHHVKPEPYSFITRCPAFRTHPLTKEDERSIVELRIRYKRSLS
jgi:hypothetical protein